MTVNVGKQHLAELDENGFTVIGGAVGQDHLAQFEQQIAELVAAQVAALGFRPRHRDPFVDLFTVGGAYTSRLFSLLERLLVLHQISAAIADDFGREGFFEHAGIKVPLVWPDIRADMPGDATRLLPVHQDYKSMQCKTAYRLWIPLRQANEKFGSMCAYVGTHRQGPVPHELGDPLSPQIAPECYRDCERVVFDLPAGDAVLINPLLFHASVPNRSRRTRFTLMIQIQDLATMIDPGRAGFGAFGQATSARQAAEASAGRL